MTDSESTDNAQSGVSRDNPYGEWKWWFVIGFFAAIAPMVVYGPKPHIYAGFLSGVITGSFFLMSIISGEYSRQLDTDSGGESA